MYVFRLFGQPYGTYWCSFMYNDMMKSSMSLTMYLGQWNHDNYHFHPAPQTDLELSNVVAFASNEGDSTQMPATFFDGVDRAKECSSKCQHCHSSARWAKGQKPMFTVPFFASPTPHWRMRWPCLAFHCCCVHSKSFRQRNRELGTTHWGPPHPPSLLYLQIMSPVLAHSIAFVLNFTVST